MFKFQLREINGSPNPNRQEFSQIYELLDQEMFTEVQNRCSLVTYRAKFRAIAMFVLHILFGRRVTLLKKRDINQDQISFQEARKLVQKISGRFRGLLQGKDFFEKEEVLKFKDVLEKIKQADENDKVYYLQFLRRVFEKNCKNLEWKEVVSLLFSQQQQKTDKVLSTALNTFPQSLIFIQDSYTKDLLVKYGIQKPKVSASYSQSILKQSELVDKEVYLQYLLSSASLNRLSVADQISQQKYTSSQSLFYQIVHLINRCSQEQAKTNYSRKFLKLPSSSSNEHHIQEPTPQSQLLNYTQEGQEKACKYLQTKLQKLYQQENGPNGRGQKPELLEDTHARKNISLLSPENLEIVKRLQQDLKADVTKNNSFVVKAFNQNSKILGKYLNLF